MHVRRGKLGGGSTTKKYLPEENSPPSHVSTMSILPTVQALTGEVGKTKEVLQVGFVVADEPEKFVQKDGKTATKATKASAAMARPGRVLIAVVDRTDYVATTPHKFYVAVNPNYGLCDLRFVNLDQIFFFSEYWHDIAPNQNIRAITKSLGLNLRAAAARTKTIEPLQQIAIVDGKDHESTLSNVLSVTKQEKLSNLLDCAVSLFNDSNSPDWFEHIDEAYENAAAVLKQALPEGYQAAARFFDASATLDEGDAQTLVQRLQVSTFYRFIAGLHWLT